MHSGISSPAAVSAPANQCPDRPGPAAAGGSWSRGTPGVPAVIGAIAVAGAGLRGGLRGVRSVLCGVGEVLAVAYAFPLIILALGIPVAVFVRLVMWIGRTAFA